MKRYNLRLIILICILISIRYSFSTIITAVEGPGNENWINAGTWDLARIPECGDTIIIPEGITVSVPANVDLDTGDNSETDPCTWTHIIVAGTLSFSNGTRFELGENTCIDFTESGLLTTQGGGKGTASVLIGDDEVWKKSDGDWVGPDDLGCTSILPVELVSFNYEIISNSVELTFETESERELDYFVIEVSRDGSFWQELDEIDAKGNSFSKNKYVLIDKNPFNGLSYYRLKNVNNDGNGNILEIISCNFTLNNFLIYPIPINKIMFIEGDNIVNSNITFINSLGENIEINKTEIGEKLSFDFEDINSGVYFIVIEKNNIKTMEKIIVVKK